MNKKGSHKFRAMVAPGIRSCPIFSSQKPFQIQYTNNTLLELNLPSQVPVKTLNAEPQILTLFPAVRKLRQFFRQAFSPLSFKPSKISCVVWKPRVMSKEVPASISKHYACDEMANCSFVYKTLASVEIVTYSSV